MAKDFTYFAGTLPMLFFGEKPSISIAAFDEDARLIAGNEVADLLAGAVLYSENAGKLPAAVQKFYDWENFLRNSLLEIRKKQRPDALDYRRNNPDFYSEVAPVLAQAANMSDLLEAEKLIDRLRWNALENFCTGHYSDLTFLAIYRIKLQILEKYSVRTSEAGNQVLETILSKLMDSGKTN